jgi:hypothetical protein
MLSRQIVFTMTWTELENTTTFGTDRENLHLLIVHQIAHAHLLEVARNPLVPTPGFMASS